MDERNRRQLARECRASRRSLLVLDDALAVYLACVPANERLRAFFECTLPFTDLMPYSTTSSVLPPEMFFGRRREAKALATSGGFVYGGRQVGKTVLLRYVERQEDKPDLGRVARYIDLKPFGIGTPQCQPDELWRILARSCHEVFEDSVPGDVSFGQFEQRVLAWRESHSDGHGKVLLLLDEADDFLKADGEDAVPFSRCSKLKGLMERTDRDFRVVLAGLHNVQRATRIANNPLAHFGTPWCVGPLLGNGEARQAAELVLRPLAALGVRFENRDLVHSILARTNYYPNLIQIYCQNLLLHVTEQQDTRRPDEVPPYTVTAREIDDVYERRDLRFELRDKFRLTLDLDRRFLLIAYLLASHGVQYPEGMSVEQLRQEAFEWWSDGFKADVGSSQRISHESFHNLLDEMRGLGILRTSRDGLYGLRSPNVAALLGTQDEVEEQLFAAISWEPPLVFTPSASHSLIDPEGSRWHRSPLTAEQEGGIKTGAADVHIVVGLPAAGLMKVKGALEHLLGRDYVRVPEGANSLDGFSDSISLLTKRAESGKTILLVEDGQPWDAAWVQHAAERLPNFRRADARTGIVFICGPARWWNMGERLRFASRRAVSVYALHRWGDTAIRQWLQDLPYVPDKETRNRVADATGGWHMLIDHIARREPGDRKQLNRLLGSIADLSELRREPGLDSAFGLDIVPAGAVLEVIAELGGGIDDTGPLAELVSDRDAEVSLQDVKHTVRWAEQLELVARSERDWRLDPIVFRMLQTKLAR